MKKEDLVPINTSKIVANKSNYFLTLGLIRNDLGDLAYLQGLFKKESNALNLPRGLSARAGQVAGRDIYCLRLVLSQLYSALEFLDQRTLEDLEIDKFCDGEDKKIWEKFKNMASYIMTKDSARKEKILKEISADEKEIAELSYIVRHNLTYHYKNSSNWLGQGYNLAFREGGEEHTKNAYITEQANVYKNRSYYIDLSIQKYLENYGNLPNNSLFEKQNVYIKIIAELLGIITKILQNYHMTIADSK